MSAAAPPDAEKDSKSSAPGNAVAVSVPSESGGSGAGGGAASSLVVLGVSEIGTAIRAIDSDLSSQNVWQTRLSESEIAESKCAALIAALDAKSEATDSQYKELQTRLAAANAERKELQSKLQALNSELKADSALLAQASDEARRLNLAAANARVELTAAKQAYKTCEAEVKALTSVINSLERDSKVVEHTLSVETEVQTDANAKLLEQQKELKNAESELATARADSERITAALRAVETRIESSTTAVEEAQASLDAETAKQREAISSYQSLLRQLELANQSMRRVETAEKVMVPSFVTAGLEFASNLFGPAVGKVASALTSERDKRAAQVTAQKSDVVSRIDQLTLRVAEAKAAVEASKLAVIAAQKPLALAKGQLAADHKLEGKLRVDVERASGMERGAIENLSYCTISVSEAESSVAMADARVAAANKKNADVTKRLDTANSKLTALTTKLEAAESNISKANDSWKRATQIEEAAVTAYNLKKEQCAKLRSALSTARTTALNAESDLSALKDMSRELSSERTLLTRDKARLHSEVQSLKTAVSLDLRPALSRLHSVENRHFQTNSLQQQQQQQQQVANQPVQHQQHRSSQIGAALAVSQDN